MALSADSLRGLLASGLGGLPAGVAVLIGFIIVYDTTCRLPYPVSSVPNFMVVDS